MIWLGHLHHKIVVLTVKYHDLNSQKLFQDQKKNTTYYKFTI